MSYTSGESSALTILRTSSTFDAVNSASLANHSPAGAYGRLDSGAAAQYVFLRPGAFARTPSTLAQVRTEWTTTIELWVRYGNASAYQILANAREQILAAFDKYTTLDDMAGVTQSFVEAGGPVTVDRSPVGGARYLRQDLTLVWAEESAPNLAD